MTSAIDQRLKCLQVCKLLQSVRQRDWLQIEKLNRFGIPHLLNYLDQADGSTALTIAASCNDVEMLSYLLKLGALPDAPDSMGRTAAMRAAECGYENCIDVIGKARGSFTVVDNEGKGILFYCVSPISLKCAELAIRNGADVNNRSKDGMSILVEACLCENDAKEISDLCLLLLEQGADVNSDNEVTGQTALMAASLSGRESVVRELLARGADIHRVMSNSLQAAHLAASNGHIKILQMLSGYGGRFDVQTDDGETPLHFAARANHAAACRFLSQRGCDPRVKNNKGLTARILAQQLAGRKTIAECRRVEKSFGNLMKNTEPWAVTLYDFVLQRKQEMIGLFEDIDGDQLGRIRNDDFLAVLKETSAPLPADDSSELRKLILLHENENTIDYAVFVSGKKYINKKYRMNTSESKKRHGKRGKRGGRRKGKIRVAIPVCVKPDGSRSIDGGPPDPYVSKPVQFVDPTRLGQKSVTSRLAVEDDARWYCNTTGNTYLSLTDVVRHSDWSTMALCTSRGLPTNQITDKYYKKPLMTAALEGQLDMVKYLVENGADVNARDNFQWTPLHFGCRGGDTGVVQYLLDHGAEINAVTLCGATPVMRAIETGRPDLVALLLDRGASLTQENRKGKTSMNIATMFADPRVYDLVKAKWDSLPRIKPKSKNARVGKNTNTIGVQTMTLPPVSA